MSGGNAWCVSDERVAPSLRPGRAKRRRGDTACPTFGTREPSVYGAPDRSDPRGSRTATPRGDALKNITTSGENGKSLWKEIGALISPAIGQGNQTEHDRDFDQYTHNSDERSGTLKAKK